MQRIDTHPAADPLEGRGTGTRLDVVDALRGFALFGVAVSNVAVFAGAGVNTAPQSPFDVQVSLVAYHLITGKFLALFALTFGLSFGLYLRRADVASGPVVARYLRRLGGLLVIGAVHHMLSGTDILMTYAVLGVVLLLLRNATDRVLLLGAICSLALPDLWRGLADWVHFRAPVPSVTRAERARLAVEGPYLELVRVRAVMLTSWWNGLLRERSQYLTLFLLGLWAARKRVLELPERRRLLWTAFWGGIILTACGYVAQAALRPALAAGPGFWATAAFGIAWNTTALVQAIGYGAGLALLWSRGGIATRLLRHLVPAGRMALTNYLTISALTTLVITLTRSYGRLTFTEAAGAGVVLWVVEIVTSAWWLRRHRLGPVEWLWRSMTYGVVQRMRMVPAVVPER